MAKEGIVHIKIIQSIIVNIELVAFYMKKRDDKQNPFIMINIWIP